MQALAAGPRDLDDRGTPGTSSGESKRSGHSAWVRIDLGEPRMEALRELAGRNHLSLNEQIVRLIDSELVNSGITSSPVVPFSASRRGEE